MEDFSGWVTDRTVLFTSSFGLSGKVINVIHHIIWAILYILFIKIVLLEFLDYSCNFNYFYWITLIARCYIWHFRKYFRNFAFNGGVRYSRYALLSGFKFFKSLNTNCSFSLNRLRRSWKIVRYCIAYNIAKATIIPGLKSHRCDFVGGKQVLF